MGAAAVWEALDQAPFGFILVLPEPARELHEPTAYAAKGPKPLSRQRRRPVTEGGPSGSPQAQHRHLEPDYRRPDGHRRLRYVAPCPPSAGPGETLYHSASHLILKSKSKSKPKIRAELEPRYGIEP